MLNDLYTAAGEALSGTPWGVYPRPQMKRESYVNLNGLWDFAVSGEKRLPTAYEEQILVPFCPESLLSGLHRSIEPGSWLWYRKHLTLPAGRWLLHIGAADQTAYVYGNGALLGSHTGGYNAFTVELPGERALELVIGVFDDLRDNTLPYGKQSLHRGGMWYTPVSGIWQSVWLEQVPETYVEKLDIEVTLRSAVITVHPTQEGAVVLEGKRYPLQDGRAEVFPEAPRLWSPEDPYLYPFTVETETDRVESYFALRTLEVKPFGGIPRLCLNGQPYFFHGLLDQGYWSDGIYTPASPESYTDDILAMKNLGFNMLRKHIKVEPEQFYYDCDRLGMVVFQDMVNNSDYSFLRDTALPTVGVQKWNDKGLHRNPASRKAFLEGMEATVEQLKNHPCICCWTIFNEGWGQFDSAACYQRLKALDDSRFIDSTSGWFRGNMTDVDSRHIYFSPWRSLQPGKKPLVLSEFGGFAYAVPGHLFNEEKAYGYKTCKTQEQFRTAMAELYVTKVLPAVERGVCAAVLTQVSDVEDEINGLRTYDRKVCKADPEAMRQLAQMLQDGFRESCGLTTHTDP